MGKKFHRKLQNMFFAKNGVSLGREEREGMENDPLSWGEGQKLGDV
jgi:hypothetical protein